MNIRKSITDFLEQVFPFLSEKTDQTVDYTKLYNIGLTFY